MKKTLIIIALIVVGFIGFSQFYSRDPLGATWLHGTWGLEYDPDGGRKDYMEFFDDGTVAVKAIRNRTSRRCNYQVKLRLVMLICTISGEQRKVPLKVSPDKFQLTNSSGAFYLRES